MPAAGGRDVWLERRGPAHPLGLRPVPRPVRVDPRLRSPTQRERLPCRARRLVTWPRSYLVAPLRRFDASCCVPATPPFPSNGSIAGAALGTPHAYAEPRT